MREAIGLGDADPPLRSMMVRDGKKGGLVARIAGPADVASPPRTTRPPHEPGKGGSQHRYLQSLIRELGQQQGFRATVEAPAGDGQVDVLLERDGLRIAFEVSVTTPTGHEAANLRKCLASGVGRAALVLVKSRATGARFREAVLAGMDDADRSRVAFLTAEELPDYIESLTPPPDPTETLVKGYRVKVSRVVASADETRMRRDAVVRIVARSLSREG